MNTATAYDIWKTEPEDNSIEEHAFDAECDRWRDDFWRNGELPNGIGAADIDSTLADRYPEAFQELGSADNDDEILAVAKRINEKRSELIEEAIVEGIEQHQKELAEP